MNRMTALAFCVVGLLLEGCGQVSVEEAQSLGETAQAVEVTDPCYSLVGSGTYEGFICGSSPHQFIETRNLDCRSAYDNCVLNARNNPSASVLCTWNGRVLYRREVSTGGSCSQVECMSTTTTGNYAGYFCDGSHRFIATSGINCKAAFDNCVLNANNNPSTSIYCEWNTRVIYRKDLSANACNAVAASTP